MKKYLLPVFVIIVGISIASGIVVRAETLTTDASVENTAQSQGIVFPIPELGNCGSKDACRTYCNDSTHIDACIAFAKAHGLMNAEEADRAGKFQASIQNGGPGGCTSPSSCETYCRDISHLKECIAFAEAHGLKAPNVGQSKKILEYLNSGGTMPGGCTSKDACEAYCSDFSHADECAAFAKKIGVIPGASDRNTPSSVQFQKLLGLVKSGETPGGCASRDACETYCKDPAHRQECVSFGERVGFITEKQAVEMRGDAGKGPGGCSSLEACRAYCNDKAHYDECLVYGESHGLIKLENVSDIKNGVARLRTGLENVPPEVAACVKSSLSGDQLNKIQAGDVMPGVEVIDRVRACFEKFGRPLNPAEIFKNAPSEVTQCLKDKFGDTLQNIISDTKAPTPEMADTIRVCLQGYRLNNGVLPAVLGGNAVKKDAPHTIQNFIQSAPQKLRACIEERMGNDLQKLSGGVVQDIDTSKLKPCFEEFRPMMPGVPQDGNSDGELRGIAPGRAPVTMPGIQRMLENLSPEAISCVKSVVGEEGIQKLESGAALEQGFAEKIKSCFQSGVPGVRGEMPVFVKPERQFCVQVVTPAKNPETGECKQFPTPCDVPQGWIRGGCDTSISLPPQQNSSAVCSDKASCLKVCFDFFNSAYASDVCVRFRNYINTVPTQSMQPVTPDSTQLSEQAPPPPPGPVLQTPQQPVTSPLPTTDIVPCVTTDSLYYNTDKCVKIRMDQLQQPSSGNPVQSLLGSLIAPFLNLLSK